MAFTDKGTLSTGALAIAFATENPVKAKLAYSYILVSFSTDLADGAEGSIVLTFDSVTPTTGGSPQASCKSINWPSNVRWEAGNGYTDAAGRVYQRRAAAAWPTRRRRHLQIRARQHSRSLLRSHG